MEKQDLIQVCQLSEVKENTLNEFTVNGNPLLVVHLEDGYHVLNNTCPHKGGNLSKGILVNGCVQCPLHHAQFNLSTGEPVKGPEISKIGLLNNAIKGMLPKLQTYNVVTQNDQLFINGTITKQKTMA